MRRETFRGIIQLLNIPAELKLLFVARVEDNANLNRVQSVQYSTFGPRYNGNSNNTRGFPASILKKAGASGEDDNEGYEARNEEVIRRVVEMKQILQVMMVGFLSPLVTPTNLGQISGFF